MRLFGQQIESAREIDIDDIFVSRLALLTIMLKSFLKGCPMGVPRKKALLNNARHIQWECTAIGPMDPRFAGKTPSKIAMEFSLYQRVNLLSMMGKSIALGKPMGTHRKKVMEKNLDMICAALDHKEFKSKDALMDSDVLKVA